MLITNNYNAPQYRPQQFTGYKSVFSRKLESVVARGKADEPEKTFLTDWMKKFVDIKLRAKRRIGEGFHGEVYKIDDKYVLKIHKHYRPQADIMDDIPKLKFSSLKTYYGEPVASFLDIKILKNVSSNGKHIQAGIPEKYSRTMTDEQCNKYLENVYLPIFSEVPQKSFDAIAKDCDTLNKMGREYVTYAFDYLNPNNFVLVGKTLRITDVICKESTQNPNTVSDLLYVFIQKSGLDTYAEYSKKAEPLRRELLKKIVLAGMRHNLPLGDNPYGRKVWQVVSSDLCKSKEYHLTIIDNLKKLQEEIPDTKLRLKKTEEYLDEIYKPKEVFGFSKKS